MTGIFDGAGEIIAINDGADPIIKVYEGENLIVDFGVAPPTINDDSFIGINSGGTVQNISAPTFAIDDAVLAIGVTGGNVTFSGAAGATDDTYTEINQPGGVDAGFAVFEGTVVSSFDASVNFTLSVSRRFAGGLITISGTSGIDVEGDTTGVSNDPSSPAVITTVPQCLITHVIGMAGGWNLDDLLAALPAGTSFGAAAVTVEDAGANDAHATVAYCFKTQETAGSTGAATWTDGMFNTETWFGWTGAWKP